MHLHGLWGVHYALALGLALHWRSGEGFGAIPASSRRSLRTLLASSTSPLPPPGAVKRLLHACSLQQVFVWKELVAVRRCVARGFQFSVFIARRQQLNLSRHVQIDGAG